MNPAPSAIHFNCQSCGTLLTVPVEMAGITGPCPQCQVTITSPLPVQQPASAFGSAPFPSMPGKLSGMVAIPPQQPAVTPWHQGASPAASPLATPVNKMTGSMWPPGASAVSAPQMKATATVHPVIDRLLQTQPQLTAIPPYQQRSLGPPRKRMSSSRDQGRRGAMWMALFMAMLVLGGTSWFFRDQLEATWRSYTLKEDDAPPSNATAPPPAPVTPGTLPDGGAAKFDPTVPSVPRATPVAVPVPNPPGPKSPPTTVMPALPAHSAAPSKGGGLVEVPSTSSHGPPVNVAVLVDMTPECRPALDALTKFFQASTWQERLPFVQAPDSMQPVMEQYYAATPDGALHPTHIQLIRHDKTPETGPPHCVFQVTGGGLKQPLPIMVEITESGWKVDWLTFTEFKDDLLAKFLAAPQPEPARFHVLMRRAHYFDDDVPSLDKKTCYQVMPPMPGFTGDVFAQKGTSLARELDKHLGWDVSQAAAVVELQWRKEDRYQWVELTGLVQLNWRNGEAPAPKAQAVEPDEPTAAAKK